MADLGTWPSSILPRTFRMVLETNQIVNESPQGGNEQVVDRLNDHWSCSITLPTRKHAEASALEALLNRFRGQVNWINLWHMGRPTPRGTLAGAPTLVSAAAQGADELRIATTAGATLLAGDLVGVGGLLFMIAEDCTAGGAGTLVAPIVNRVRTAQSLGTSVSWDKPTTSFRLLGHTGQSFVPGRGEEVTLEFRERVA